MPTNTYKCNNCSFVNEYIESFSTTKENWHPDVCPECNTGTLEKIFDMAGHSIGIDFVGSGFYINDYGIHNWKKNKTDHEISKVLADNVDPY
jgi:predicted nucleic acid-binding Zn ribbon protein